MEGKKIRLISEEIRYLILLAGERSELIVPSTQTSVVLEGLKEDQEYGVIIQGLTADGQESPLSDPAFGTPENNSKFNTDQYYDSTPGKKEYQGQFRDTFPYFIIETHVVTPH